MTVSSPSRPRAIRNRLVDVARGAAIGSVEVVPGVSGGTMALIVGVYERLIDAGGQVVRAGVGGIDALRGRGTERARAALRTVDWPLIGAVLLGMVLALGVASRVLPPLIEAHPVATSATFFGMVAASVLVPLLALGAIRGVREWALVVASAVITWLITSLPAASSGDDPPLLLVGVAAAVAICALVLPGLSGSFLLLVLGLYEPTLAALAAGDLAYIAVFLLGATLGLGSFVRLLQWLLDHHRRGLLLVVAGLLVGALRALWPWQAEDRTLLAPDAAWPAMVPLALAGAAVVVVMALVQHRRDRAATAGGDGFRDDEVSPDAPTQAIPRPTR